MALLDRFQGLRELHNQVKACGAKAAEDWLKACASDGG